MTVKHVFHRICLLLSVFFLFGIVTVPVRAEENESKKELKMKTTSLVMIGDSSHKLKLSKKRKARLPSPLRRTDAWPPARSKS